MQRSPLQRVVQIAAILLFLAGSLHAQLAMRDIEILSADLAAGGATFTIGPNSATVRSIEELCGARPPKAIHAPGRKILLSQSESDSMLPQRFDWREIKGCPPVRDQGNCGACWAFASIAPLEAALFLKNDIATDLSEQWLVSCNNRGWGCAAGGWWAYDLLKNPGSVLESDYPYTAQDSPCIGQASYHWRIRDWGFVFTEYDVAPRDEIKRAIMKYGPVSSALYVGPAFQAYTGGIFNISESGPDIVNHTVTIVGWDDTISGGIWIVRNSWGPDWGEAGYIRIRYGVSLIGYSATYVTFNGGVEFQGLTIDDDTTGPSIGNGNGDAEPGETIELSCIFINNETETAKDTSVVISSSDPAVAEIINEKSLLGDIAPGEETATSTPLVVRLNSDLPQGHNILFNARISGGTRMWQTMFEIPVKSDPEAHVLPSRLTCMIGPDKATTLTITLENTGTYPLNYHAGILDIPPATGRGLFGTAVEGPTCGGPDAYGHMWISSDDPEGPIHEWRDIGASGTPVTLGDDDAHSVTLPFLFSLYGDPKDKVLICSNGYLTFGETGDAFSNPPIPYPEEPNDLIAPLWTDLNPSLGSGRIYYYHDTGAGEFAVQWDHVRFWGSEDEATFQSRLLRNGDILFTYHTVAADYLSAVGIEDATGARGLQVARRDDFPTGGQTIRISLGADWIECDKPAGVLPPGETKDLVLKVNGAGLASGEHRGRIIIFSNDPGGVIQIPLDVHIMEEQLLVCHQPRGDMMDEYTSCSVEATVLSTNGVAPGNAWIYWKRDGDTDFQTAIMHETGPYIWLGDIPGQPAGTTIQYYIRVEDIKNNIGTNPVNAPASLHSFRVYPLPRMALEGMPQNARIRPGQRETRPGSLLIRNTGGNDLQFNAAITAAGESLSQNAITISPAEGVVPPGNIQPLTLYFNAEGLSNGDYAATLTLTGNDPLTPRIEAPLAMSVDDTLPPAEWTLMVYMAADNNLEPYAILDFIEMATINLPENIHVALQMDRHPSFDKSFGDWSISHRFVMREGLIPVEEEAVPDWGDGLGGREVNMGNPMVLQEFMEWGMSHFPAKRHALILWNHGAGWRGDSKTETRQICQDTTSNDWLYTQELGETLKNAPPGTGLVGMDACLGGTVEAAYEIKAPDMVIVASEADVPASGWPYHLVLGDLATTPTLSAPELGHAIVERYRQTHGGKYPLSSVDLSLMNDLAAASAEFTSATLACSSEWPRIGEARRHTPALDTAGELVDIITLLGNIEELSRDDSIRIRAREMASAMERACLSYYHPPLTPARGLSVYFPDPRRYKKPDENYTCGQLSWACDTGWDKLIAAFLAADTNPPTLLHSPLGDTLETGPYTITATASDISGIGEVRLLWRKNGGPLRETVMKSIGEGSYSSQIPGPAMTGDVFCYRIMASDIPGNRSFFPGPSEDVLHIFSIGPSLEGLWEDFDGVNRIFDLSGKRLVFRPSLDLPTQYDLCLEDITGWSTDPTTGTALILGDDDFAALELEPGSVWFFGCSFDRIYVGSNGYITFGQGGTTYQAAALNHFNLPRISPAMGDLNPENGSGNIIYQILPDRVAVSWNGVAQVQGPGTNRFQAEMFRDGTIRFTWLEIHLNDVLVGISRGQGLPAGSETDFSTFDKCPEENPPRADVETPEDPGGFVRAAFTLTQESGCSAHVRIEYSADGGKNFEEATAAPGNETGGILFSSPGGRRYIFLWNTLIDTGPGRHEHVRLRVRPWTDLEGPGIAGEAGPFEIINPGWGEVVDCILARSAPPGEDARVLDVNKDGVVSVSDVLVLMYNEMYKTAP